MSFSSALETFGRFQNAYDKHEYPLALSLLSQLKVAVVTMASGFLGVGSLSEEKKKEFLFCSCVGNPAFLFSSLSFLFFSYFYFLACCSPSLL
jgi:hypothetical protein